MISLRIEGPVAVATLSRPPVNAIDEGWIARLHEVLGMAAAARVLLIRSSQRAFSAGADLALMRSRFDSAAGRAQMVEFARAMQRANAQLEASPLVSIAEIGGAAMGGGLELALACDLRFAAKTAKMGLPEVSLGIIPGYGGTQRLPRLVGRGLALEHLILGTQISAQECYRIGLVNRLSKEGETLNDAKALAREIVKRPPVATRLIIEAVDDGIQAPIDQALEIELRAFEKVLKTEDAGEGIQAFFQKRPAQFKGK